MDTNLCRICGNLGQNFCHIFNTDGLKTKLETCLPIIVSPFCLLPDTICGECVEQIDNYHAFIKKSLQNIIVLETQFNVQQSCLKSKQTAEKSCYTDFEHTKISREIQTEDYLDVLCGQHFDFEEYKSRFPQTSKFLDNLYENERKSVNIVGYDVDSDDSEEMERTDGPVTFPSNLNCLLGTNSLTKSVIFKSENNPQENSFVKGRNQIPKQIDSCSDIETKDVFNQQEKLTEIVSRRLQQRTEDGKAGAESGNVNNRVIKLPLVPHSCLMCNLNFSDAVSLELHVSDIHCLDRIVSSPPDVSSIHEKTKKKLPNLVKISNLKKPESLGDNNLSDNLHDEDPPRLHPTFVCPNCPEVFKVKSVLLMHSQLCHPEQAAYLCGICTRQCTSWSDLKKHVQPCSTNLKITNKFICQICQYSDDNLKFLETHVEVHKFLLDECRKQSKLFNAADYVDTKENVGTFNGSPITKNPLCGECGLSDFSSFQEFSKHRRMAHSIYHCDLCNKFYGRSSHLWKHVNRLHKGHPSVTCSICSKTSASKYHSAQHYNKIHLAKNCKQKGKLQREKLIEKTSIESDQEESLIPTDLIKLEIKEESEDAPKEIDRSHNLFNNIITNYTPSVSEGEFKCLKCSKGFHKKLLLKKHKKNCRPKMQKDLLTRCKSCSRVFKDRQSLTKHLINYHSDYICEICDQKFPSKCEIVSHIRFQHSDCDLICKTCNNVLRSRNEMQEHLRNHFESYICQFCGDSLPNKVKLKMHILSLHRKILSLSCGICLKLFENQHVLKDHVNLLHKHELVPFASCRVCGKNYGSKWKTYDHINKSHGKTFKACRTCLDIFNNEAQLQAHCDVTSHGPSSGFNSTALRDTIMAMVKSVVEQKTENNNGNLEDRENSNSQDTEGTEDDKNRSTQNIEIPLLEANLTRKRHAEEDDTAGEIFGVVKKFKTDVKEDVLPQTTSSKRTVYINGNDPACCEICLKSWPAKKHLWQHYIRCHKTEAATVCGICLKINGTYEALQKHLQENHPKLLHGQGFGSNFICKICGRYHNASSKLRLHMIIHADFDWRLLEKRIGEIAPKTVTQDDINYESFIEQIEYSSNSEEEDEGTDEKHNGSRLSSNSKEQSVIFSEGNEDLSLSSSSSSDESAVELKH